MNIDIEKVKARRKELGEECRRLDDLLAYAEEFGDKEAPKIAPKQIPLIVAPEAPPKPMGAAKPAARTTTPGLRKSALLALADGRLTFSEVARALVWNPQQTREVICSMISCKLCTVDDHGCVELSRKGKDQAAWFQTHPHYMIFKPHKWEGA